MKRKNQRCIAASLIALASLALLDQTAWAQPIVYAGTNAATGLGQLRVINSDGTGDRLLPLALPEPGFPSFSKDGRFMAITSQVPGRPNQSTKNVFLLDLLTAQLSQITQLEDHVTADDFTYYLTWYHALSPDSTAIAVQSFIRNRNGTIPNLQIFRVSDGLLLNTPFVNKILDGRTEGGNGVDWHGTSNLLVYPCDIDIAVYLPNGTPTGYYYEGTALYTGPWNQAPTRKLTDPVATYYYLDNGARIAKSGETDYAPAFSPNGQQVAYARATWIEDTAYPMNRQPSVLALRIVNVDGSNDHVVIQLNQGVYVTHLSWSRDGTQLLFDAGTQLIVGGTPANLADPATDALWIVSTNGTGLHNVRGAFAGLPVWSPAGTTFCNLGVTAGGGAAGSIDDCGAPLNLKGTRLPSGQYRVDITGGAPNLLYRILTTANFTSWQTIGTMTRTNTTTSFVDPSGSNLARRFYRVVLGN